MTITIILYMMRLLYKSVYPVYVYCTSMIYSKQTKCLPQHTKVNKMTPETSTSAVKYSKADKSIQPSLTVTLQRPPTPDLLLTYINSLFYSSAHIQSSFRIKGKMRRWRKMACGLLAKAWRIWL